MAITDTRPATEALTAPPGTEQFHGLRDHEPTGLAGFIGTGDHRALGRAYLAVAAVLGLGALALDGVFHLNLSTEIIHGSAVPQVYALSRIALVLLFAMPLFIGLATYVVPLQVGASTIAFPRAAAMAFWGWLVGAGLLIAGFAINGGIDGTLDGVRPKGVDLTLAGLALLIVALLVAAITIVTTVIALRTTGNWLDRVPVFSWSMVVAGSFWIFTLPVLLANVLLLFVDHHYATGSGLGPNAWAQLGWAFGQPEVYVVAIPVLGIVTDVMATLSGARQPLRSVVLASIAAFGFLSFGAFAQTAFAPEVTNQVLYIAMGLLAVLPVLACAGCWAAALKQGKPLLRGPLLLAGAAALLLLLATLAGAVFVIKPFKLHDAAWGDVAGGTFPFADGHLLLVVAAALVGALAGVAYWSPKLFGRFANDGLAKLAALVGLLGGLVAALPLMVYGFSLRFSGLSDAGKAMNGISVAGVALLAAALVLIGVAVAAAKRGDAPADDAWGRGQTLEWATSSPPARGNFGTLEPVRSPEPLLDAAASQEAL